MLSDLKLQEILDWRYVPEIAKQIGKHVSVASAAVTAIKAERNNAVNFALSSAPRISYPSYSISTKFKPGICQHRTERP